MKASILCSRAHFVFREKKTLEHRGLLTKNNRWCLAAAAFFILEERHLQAIALSLWPVALQWRKIAQIGNNKWNMHTKKVVGNGASALVLSKEERKTISGSFCRNLVRKT